MSTLRKRTGRAKLLESDATKDPPDLKDYRKAGAIINVTGGKGSHRKISHPNVPRTFILSGKDGDDAKPYMEKDLKEFIDELNS